MILWTQYEKLYQRVMFMNKKIINLAAIGLFVFAMTGCGNAASDQTETMEEKVRTEIPADSIIQLIEPDKTFDVSLMQALSDRKSRRESRTSKSRSKNCQASFGLPMASIVKTVDVQLPLLSTHRTLTSMSACPMVLTSTMPRRVGLTESPQKTFASQ